MNVRISLVLMMLLGHLVQGQEIILDKVARVQQAYLDAVESPTLLPMNDLDVEFGYVLYQAKISTETENAELSLENVRDYAVVYLDGELQGVLTDGQKKIILKNTPGTYQLRLYVENIGRITYGPEILDNSKGLFGSVTLDEIEVEGWVMTPLHIRNMPIQDLNFENRSKQSEPCFYAGIFTKQTTEPMYLDITGWGMGEVWINNRYLGSYWENEKQQSISIPQEVLQTGENKIVVFELKNHGQQSMKLSQSPVFR